MRDGRPHEVLMFGRPLRGTIVGGPWAGALTELTGVPMRLMRAVEGPAQDAYPMSLLSRGSIEEVSRQAGMPAPLDPRRFRNSC